MSTAEFISIVAGATLLLSVVFTQWRSGSKQVSAEVMDNYEKLVNQLREQVAHYEQEFGNLKAEMANMEKGLIAKIAKLEGALGEKEKQNGVMAEILANRNPELENVLREIRDFMKTLNETTNHQTRILEASQTRNRVIDDATDAQVGNVMRKKNI